MSTATGQPLFMEKYGFNFSLPTDLLTNN